MGSKGDSGMSQYDHEAIRKAYPNVVVIRDDDGIYEQTGTDENEGAILNKITIEQSKVDAARVTLDAESAATLYQRQRKEAYPAWDDQLDYLYHHGIEKWKTDMVDPVKNKYPKPS
jgi:hypothetical protein